MKGDDDGGNFDDNSGANLVDGFSDAANPKRTGGQSHAQQQSKQFSGKKQANRGKSNTKNSSKGQKSSGKEGSGTDDSKRGAKEVKLDQPSGQTFTSYTTPCCSILALHTFVLFTRIYFYVKVQGYFCLVLLFKTRRDGSVVF